MGGFILSHGHVRVTEEVDFFSNTGYGGRIPLNILLLGILYCCFFSVFRLACLSLWQEYFDDRSRYKCVW